MRGKLSGYALTFSITAWHDTVTTEQTVSPPPDDQSLSDGQDKRLRADPTVLVEGDILDGRYRVEGVLGRGGFGAVYAATHLGTEQKVALKMLLGSGDDEDEVRRFVREARITAKLRHPNTVRVFDVGETESGALYIAMERLHGPTLEERLKDLHRAGEAMEEPEACEIGISVLKSLGEAHRQGVVHRDLKPANVMLTEVEDERLVKVLDFGIARPQDSSLTGAGTSLGTPAYMSPEQCRGQELDGRSDLYSLGIILFRCVTGQVPFHDRNPLTVMFKHASEPLPDLRARARVPLSDGFATAIVRALSKSPQERYADAKDMRDALMAAASGQPAPPPTARYIATTTSSAGQPGETTLDVDPASVAALVVAADAALGLPPQAALGQTVEVDRTEGYLDVGDAESGPTMMAAVSDSQKVIVDESDQYASTMAVQRGEESPVDAPVAAIDGPPDAPAGAATGGPSSATRPPAEGPDASDAARQPSPDGDTSDLASGAWPASASSPSPAGSARRSPWLWAALCAGLIGAGAWGASVLRDSPSATRPAEAAHAPGQAGAPAATDGPSERQGGATPIEPAPARAARVDADAGDRPDAEPGPGAPNVGAAPDAHAAAPEDSSPGTGSDAGVDDADSAATRPDPPATVRGARAARPRPARPAPNLPKKKPAAADKKDEGRFYID